MILILIDYKVLNECQQTRNPLLIKACIELSLGKAGRGVINYCSYFHVNLNFSKHEIKT